MEVCIDSVQSAMNAQIGGASRIELCANLTEGGTTPSIGLLKIVKHQVSIPVFVMIRPRSGDFYYSDMEMSVMKEDINSLKHAGADGFVFGALQIDGTVDEKRCLELLDAAHPLPSTFHRAIDVSRNIMESMSVIVGLGFRRVLSSGGCTSAVEGANVLTEMIEKFGSEIIIMPGGGINSENIVQVLKCGAKEYHGSASESIQSPMIHRSTDIYFSSIRDNEYLLRQTLSEKVRSLVDIANSFWNKINS